MTNQDKAPVRAEAQALYYKLRQSGVSHSLALTAVIDHLLKISLEYVLVLSNSPIPEEGE